jgi:hypothetical protein
MTGNWEVIADYILFPHNKLLSFDLKSANKACVLFTGALKQLVLLPISHTVSAS